MSTGRSYRPACSGGAQKTRRVAGAPPGLGRQGRVSGSRGQCVDEWPIQRPALSAQDLRSHRLRSKPAFGPRPGVPQRAMLNAQALAIMCQCGALKFRLNACECEQHARHSGAAHRRHREEEQAEPPSLCHAAVARTRRCLLIWRGASCKQCQLLARQPGRRPCHLELAAARDLRAALRTDGAS